MGKKVDYSVAVFPQKLPVKEQTLDFMQQAAREMSAAIFTGIMNGIYTAGDVIVIWGCNNTGTGLNYIISAGAVYYNGEYYEVDAVTFTASVGQVAVGNIVLSNSAADPVKLKPSGTNVYVHQIRKFVFSSAVSGTGIKDFSAMKTVLLNSRSILQGTGLGPGQGITSTSLTLLTGCSFTTPNDGRTRFYKIFFKARNDQSSSAGTAIVRYELQVDGTAMDKASTGRNNSISDVWQLNTTLMYWGFIGPNKVIRIMAAKEPGLDSTVYEAVLNAEETY